VGGTEYIIIGFEGSQALPVCPSGKCNLLTGAFAYYKTCLDGTKGFGLDCDSADLLGGTLLFF
jgi:hypothetical protein